MSRPQLSERVSSLTRRSPSVKARIQHILPRLCFSDRSENKDDRPASVGWDISTFLETADENILRNLTGNKYSTSPVEFLGHRSRRLQWPIVIRRCPASVRPLYNLHFQLLLQNHLIDFDETWYGGSTQVPLQVLLFFGQIRPGADPGRGKNRSRGSPSSKNFFFRPEGYSNKPNA